MKDKPDFTCRRCGKPATGEEPDSRTLCNPCRIELTVEVPFECPPRWTHDWTDYYGEHGAIFHRLTEGGRIFGLTAAPDYWMSLKDPMKTQKDPWPSHLQIGAIMLQCPTANNGDGIFTRIKSYSGVSGPGICPWNDTPANFLHPLLQMEAGRPGFNYAWSYAFPNVDAAVRGAQTCLKILGDRWKNQQQMELF